MKVTNHKQGNYHFTSNSDSSVMYGSIYMTEKEWETTYNLLLIRYINAEKYKDTYVRDNLYSMFDFAKKIELNKKNGDTFSIGVTATKILFEAFGLPNYKNQNYSITITK